MTTKAGRMTIAALMILALAVPAVQARTYNFGGFRIRIPDASKAPSRSSTPGAYSTHPRWSTVIDNGFTLATNGQGIWIGYDETGTMVIQLEMRTPLAAKPETTIPVQVSVNNRFYESVMATVANEKMAVIFGPEVERILGRLMSGSSVLMVAEANQIGTHLTGSSAAIRQVRAAAAIQQRQFIASGGTTTPKADTKKTTQTAEEGIRYFLPGQQGTGTAEVRFNIVEGTGLVLYINFPAFEGSQDPDYSLPLTITETRRAVDLIRKAEEWTSIAVENRIGLFQKRIGYLDDALAAQAPKEEPAGDGMQSGNGAQAGLGAGVAGQAEPMQQAAETGQPKDFKAVNFNSYEDGTTSVQIEHSVAGFSRRFNLPLEDALELASSLEATVEFATFKLENRELDTKEKEKLFR